ncbi:Rieske 2Fe-2S domain-containing protein [Actinocorallia lasiicapitis]
MTHAQRPVDTASDRGPRGIADRRPADSPPAYPYGWFAVCFSREVSPKRVVSRRFMDQDVVVFRTEEGVLRVSEAHCPHLGAHLGHGGRVVGECLRCPFHGFTFGLDGRCVSTPYGSPPPGARLRFFPALEICGVVMAFHGPPGEEPWPLEGPDTTGFWRPYSTFKMKVDSHPQEITENSVDLGHFTVLHAFKDVEIIQAPAVSGTRLEASYGFVRRLPLLPGVRVLIEIRVDGLGCSVVDVGLLGWRMRQLVLSTPTGARGVEVYVGTSLRSRAGGRPGRILLAPVEFAIKRFLLHMVKRELRTDEAVWRHKKYLGRPALSAGDRPIATYRAWARQFYPADGG